MVANIYCPQCNGGRVQVDMDGSFPRYNAGRWLRYTLAKVTCKRCGWRISGYLENRRFTKLPVTQGERRVTFSL